jgi:hypothetical protein
LFAILRDKVKIEWESFGTMNDASQLAPGDIIKEIKHDCLSGLVSGTGRVGGGTNPTFSTGINKGRKERTLSLSFVHPAFVFLPFAAVLSHIVS